MFCNFITAVFLLFSFVSLLMCCLVCEAKSVETTSETKKSFFALFKPEKTEFETKEKYHSFTLPKLAYVKNVLVIFAQAKNITTDKEKCDIVEGYINLNDDDTTSVISDVLKKKFIENDGNTAWKNKIVIKNKEKKFTEIFTAVVDKSDIFVFLKNVTDTAEKDVKYFILKGSANEGKNENGIKWDFSSAVQEQQFKLNSEASKNFIFVAGGGSGIVTKEKYVLPVMYKINSDTYSTTINRQKNKENDWALLPQSIPTNCTFPAIAEWEEKLIMITSCSSGYRKVYEFNDTEESWKEAVGSLSGVWGNTGERKENEYSGQSGFITAAVGDPQKHVILFTQPVENADKTYNLHLWMTDYKRVHKVGAISTAVEQNITSTLLYAKENLFAAYEKWDSGNSTIYALYLKDELEIVNNVLDKWSEQDKLLARSCFIADGSLATTSEDKCINKILTNGLVGFLWKNYSNGKWTDEYLCVNAIVKPLKQQKVTNAENGLKFSGRGAGATWPVGAQGQNQLYHFANYGFSLVTTVIIGDSANDNDNCIMGIGLTKNINDKNEIRLWCTSDGEWAVSNSRELTKQKSGTKCNKGSVYQVTLVFNNKEGTMYIDGKPLNKLPENIMTIEQSQNITNFYFGADIDEASQSTAESHMTVTGVLLYNKQLTENEIEKLAENIVKPTTPDADITTGHTTPPIDSPVPPETAGAGGEGKETLSTQLSDTNREGVKEIIGKGVSVWLFVLLGVGVVTIY